ncbi:MAG TPA: Flp pilus assembly protein CpaB [Longimicrobiales bacterium]
MRQRRFWLVMVMALVSGGLAAYLSFRYLSQRPAGSGPAEPASLQAAVAVRDLPLGTILKREDVRLVDWPAGAVPAGLVQTVEDVVGRGIITPVSANEPLLASKLADPEAGGGLPIAIPPGMRAVSIKVDEVVGVAGFVLPGTRVDVLVTLDPRQEGREPSTRLVLQDVRALAAGQSVEHAAEGEPRVVPVVTLLVTPRQAEVLTLAATEGRIQLALRNTLDGDSVETPGALLSGLLGLPRGPARRAPSGPFRPPIAVEIYEGGKRSLVTF